ncbi:MAG: hypothetical protein HRU14_17025 [Planctomycetes bacterium]|nr:hypothetical protein [Planctomycetota bacterium]
MLGYTTIGTSDMDRAVAFYDALLAEVGAKQLFGMDRIKFYGTSTDAAMLALCIPYVEQPPGRLAKLEAQAQSDAQLVQASTGNAGK